MSDLSGPADGGTFDSDRDENRINLQRLRTWAAISDYQWHYPEELETAVGDNWASVSARLRDFRKPKFGGHVIVSECVRRGLWRYRLLPPAPSPPVSPPAGPDFDALRARLLSRYNSSEYDRSE